LAFRGVVQRFDHELADGAVAGELSQEPSEGEVPAAGEAIHLIGEDDVDVAALDELEDFAHLRSVDGRPREVLLPYPDDLVAVVLRVLQTGSLLRRKRPVVGLLVAADPAVNGNPWRFNLG
jgi:hypothetical protein